MKMRRFLLNKLVRDKIVERFSDQGAVVKSKVLEDNNELLEAMTQKIVEELEEVFESESQEELIVELADLEEVMDAFKKLVDIDQKDIDAVRKAKGAERGFFTKRIFAEHVDIPESATDILEYVQEQPDKYPEIDPETGDFLETNEDV